MKINVQSASESSLCNGWVQKQVKSLKSSEVYLCIDIKYVGVMTEGSTWKIKVNSKMLHIAGIQCICGAMAQWTVTYLHILRVNILSTAQSHLGMNECCHKYRVENIESKRCSSWRHRKWSSASLRSPLCQYCLLSVLVLVWVLSVHWRKQDVKATCFNANTAKGEKQKKKMWHFQGKYD